MGWVPHGASHWTTESGTLLDATDRREVRACALKDLERQRWKEVTKPGRRPKDCAGSESGIHPCTGLLWNALVRKGKHEMAGALRCILTGATWPAARKKQAGFIEDDVCPRCKEESEDVMHRWWKCPAFNDIRDRTGAIGILRRKNF